ncbi:MAG: CoA transferase [Chloroflexi bacterium]|nr:CoA transferase [Chloroflexota bacterium]
MTALLTGLRILDLTHHVAGPVAATLFADYGADVIKVERPWGGDPARTRGPFQGDLPHPERSGLFLHLNTSKRGITLNLRHETGRAIFRELAAGADAVIESFRPGAMDRLGIGYEALSALQPRLVLTSISNFGQDGPYRDFRAGEITEYAMGGPMFATGYPGREPMKLGGSVVQSHAGQAAALATVIALFGVDHAERGDHLDVSIMETQAAGQDRRATMLIAYQFIGHVNGRARRPGALGGGVRPCADGYFSVAAQAHWFPIVMDMVGHPELAEDPRFATVEARNRVEAAEELEPYILPWWMERGMRDIWREAQSRKLLSGPVYSSRDTIEDPYFRQRRYWETISHPAAGAIEYPGRPFRVHTMDRQPRRAAPTLGQHNEEVLCGELGFSRRDLGRLRAAGVI